MPPRFPGIDLIGHFAPSYGPNRQDIKKFEANQSSIYSIGSSARCQDWETRLGDSIGRFDWETQLAESPHPMIGPSVYRTTWSLKTGPAISRRIGEPIPDLRTPEIGESMSRLVVPIHFPFNSVSRKYKGSLFPGIHWQHFSCPRVFNESLGGLFISNILKINAQGLLCHSPTGWSEN